MRNIFAPKPTALGTIINSIGEWIAPDVDEKWAAMYVGMDIVEFIENNFYIQDDEKPLKLYESQIVPLREALRRDNGKLVYSTVVWSAPKKTAKTLIASAVCLYFAWQRKYATCTCIGNDQKQAAGRVFEDIKIAIQLHPEWKSVCKLTQTSILLPNGSKIEAIPIDPEGEAGAASDFVSYTEIWGWRSKAEKKLWTESTLPPSKYGYSLRWCDSYAGVVGESPILEKLYQEAVRGGKCINEQYEMYANGRTFALWMTQHHLPAPYYTPEYLEQEAASLTDSEFKRVHGNQWVSSMQTFVPYEWWNSCSAILPPVKKAETLVVAMDAAVTSDCFAIVGVGAIDGKICVRYSRAWYPPKGGKIAFQDNGNGPEDELRRLCEEYDVIEVPYDPMQLEDMAGRLSSELVAHMYAFKQGQDRLIADKMLFDMIRDRSILHSDEPDMNEHIKNANRKDEDGKLRIVKRADHLKIDLAVALSMAVSRAKFWNIAS